ncbi:N alpha-acetyl-transferase [Lecanora helva]
MAPQTSRIEPLNALSLPAFRAQFWSHPTHTQTSNYAWHISLESPSTISSLDLDQCFELIDSTSSAQYASSSVGWHPGKKRREMRLPDLKYVLLRRESDGDGQRLGPVDGFMSFMLTYEDGVEVIYCYEIHLAAPFRGMGLGKFLIGQLERVGREAGMQKAMLTVFRANEKGRRFNERLGYEEDEFSPRGKRLRGGVFREADYIILSKTLVEAVQPSLQGRKSRKRKAG